MHPEYGLKEKLTYLNLPKKFVAGTVILGDVDEVAIGADVTLTADGKTWTAKTNGFGDFEFEGLPDEHHVHGRGSRRPATRRRAARRRPSKDVYLGEIVLAKQ